jgi:MHS family proline/betaine transporter-like MFS transporter
MWTNLCGICSGDNAPTETQLGSTDTICSARQTLTISRPSCLCPLSPIHRYAFAIFGYFSDVIGDIFFPPSDASNNSSLIESFAAFGSAFITRPIGGLCLGYIGDVYGRKLALEVSVFLMAIATVGMACLPTYSRVGILSYVLLSVCRLIQGLSAGGQLMGSLVYAVESKPREAWGYHGSMVMAAANCGNVMSGVTVFVLRLWMSEEELEQIGWRLPNLVVGIILSLCGLCLKYLLEEDSIPPSELNNDTLDRSNPLKMACAQSNRRSLLAACMVPILYSTGFWLTFAWMTIYMFKLIPTPMSAPEAFGVSSLSLFLSVCTFFPIAGTLSDKFGRRIVMTVGGVGYGLLSPILLAIIGRGNVVESLASQTLMGVFLSLWGGPMMAWLVESFDPQTRLTSAAVGYNLGVMVAGVAPATATYLVDQFGPSIPGLMLSLLAVIALSGLWLVAPTPPMATFVNHCNIN